MYLWLYIVSRDFGFAPNPFHGYCTLATCKPIIRKCANVGDFVVGIASKSSIYNHKIVFIMRIDEKSTFNEYWIDTRFQIKKPIIQASKKFQFGDNIYHQENGYWIQIDSHHSNKDGTPNTNNINHDTTRTDNVLISNIGSYCYFGQKAIPLPECFPSLTNFGRGQKKIDISAGDSFHTFFDSLPKGFIGNPIMWGNNRLFERFEGERL